MFEMRDDEIDVEAIMARIRDNLRRRVSGGVELNDQGAPAGSPTEALSLFSATVAHHMNLLRLLQDPKPQGPITSHGSRLIEQAKRLIRRILAPYHRGIFARQAKFNANVVGLMAEVLQALEKSSAIHDGATLRELHTRLDTLQAEQAAQAQQIAEQTQALTGLTTRLDTLQAEQDSKARLGK